MDKDLAIFDYLRTACSRLTSFFYLANCKIQKKKDKRLYRITFKKTSRLIPTFLTITSHSKSTTIQMKYSIIHNEYFLEVWLVQRSEFVIIQRNQSYLVDSFPQVANCSGRIVNKVNDPRAVSHSFLKNSVKIGGKYLWMFESFGVSLGKIKDSNEDAFFCGQKVLGAADGIGSLKTHFGISSKEFSAELMTKCETVIKSVLSLSDKKVNCKDIIKAAYELVESGGSSTFILASLTGRQINILNLGDCGVLLIRFEDS